MFFAAEKHGANHHVFTISHHKLTTLLPSKTTVEIATPPIETRTPPPQNFFAEDRRIKAWE